MNEEQNKIIEQSEKEIAEEEELKQKVKEEIAEADDGLRINDFQQEFHEHGMMESTCDYSAQVLNKVLEVIHTFKIGDITVNRRLVSETSGGKKTVPIISFLGEEVNIRFQVMPIDKFGNNGKTWLTQEEYEELQENYAKD